jgi:hypothetical protein
MARRWPSDEDVSRALATLRARVGDHADRGGEQADVAKLAGQHVEGVERCLRHLDFFKRTDEAVAARRPRGRGGYTEPSRG